MSDSVDTNDIVAPISLPIIGIKACSNACLQNEVSCDFNECKHWIEYEEDCNCDLIAIHKHGEMTLRDIADRMQVSFVRIKQIESKALNKLNKRLAILNK